MAPPRVHFRAMLFYDVQNHMSSPMQDVSTIDEDLLAHEEHLKYRYKQYLDTKEALEKAEGSIADFAKVRISIQTLHTILLLPLAQHLRSESVVPLRLKPADGACRDKEVCSRAMMRWELEGEGNAAVCRERASAAASTAHLVWSLMARAAPM